MKRLHDQERVYLEPSSPPTDRYQDLQHGPSHQSALRARALPPRSARPSGQSAPDSSLPVARRTLRSAPPLLGAAPHVADMILNHGVRRHRGHEPTSTCRRGGFRPLYKGKVKRGLVRFDAGLTGPRPWASLPMFSCNAQASRSFPGRLSRRASRRDHTADLPPSSP